MEENKKFKYFIIDSDDKDQVKFLGELIKKDIVPLERKKVFLIKYEETEENKLELMKFKKEMIVKEKLSCKKGLGAIAEVIIDKVSTYQEACKMMNPLSDW